MYPSQYSVVLFALLLGVLQKLTSEDRVWLVLSEPLSAVALTIMSKLRQQARTGQGQGEGRRTTQAHQIVENTVAAITTHRHHATRTNLYGVLLHYSEYCADLVRTSELSLSSSSSSRDMLSISEAARELQERNRALLESYGPRLLQVVCRDASDGGAELRTMAYATLNTLLQTGTGTNSPHTYWLTLLKHNQMIQHFLQQLSTRDPQLATAVMAPTMQHYPHIINYEATMAFLLKGTHKNNTCKTPHTKQKKSYGKH